MEVNGYEIKPGANIGGANLSEANLKGADLSQAGFFRAYLQAVFSLSWDLIKRTLRISPADISGANLEGADLTGARLAQATADKGTVWPEGFDPAAAGVIFD